MSSGAKDLPAGWVESFSKSQKRPFWYNEKLKRSVWRVEDITVSDDELKRKNPLTNDDAKTPAAKKEKVEKRGINVAIIVPFRDLHVEQKRGMHLKKFIPAMEKFLNDADGVAEFKIFIVEQSEDKRRFNRGKLLNVGFRQALELPGIDFDSYIFHDVDLIPQKPLEKWYATKPTTPIHIARCWNRYNDNDKYFGGIVAFSQKDFELIDGFPNTFWGWGGEDDELALRVSVAKLKITAPPKTLPNALIDLEDMSLSEKLTTLRGSGWKCMQKWELLDAHKDVRRDNQIKPCWWGVKNAQYKLLGTVKLGDKSDKLQVHLQENKNSDGTVYWSDKQAVIQEK